MPFSWEFPYSSSRAPAMAANAVATSHPLATQAAIRMMQEGGNAVDAAIAAAAMLPLVEPTGCGLGSDAFAQIWDGKQLHGFNGSGRAPSAWSHDQFVRKGGIPDYGWDTVTVPGAVDAWEQIHQRFGRLPFSRVLDPAIAAAANGFPVSPIISAAWHRQSENYAEYPEFRRVFAPDGKTPEPGDIFRNPDLADSLTHIARNGAAWFYSGDGANAICQAARSDGASLSDQDLASHKGEWVAPIRTSCGDWELNEIPPNGQGLAALLALGMLRYLEIERYAPDDPESIHLQAEAMRLAFAIAGDCIADPDFMTLSIAPFLEERFLKKQAGRIREDQVLPPQPSLSGEAGTVCFTTADADGMMVSFIQSNYTGFGSGIVVPGTGISLQNRARGFSMDPDHPNVIGGGKRPFHTIIPGFVTKKGKPAMSFGLMGAHMQPQGHLQMVVRICIHGQNPQAASDAPRWHVCENGALALEPGFSSSVRQKLSDIGHTVQDEPPALGYGGAQLIYRLPSGYYLAASDHRKDGHAAGF